MLGMTMILLFSGYLAFLYPLFKKKTAVEKNPKYEAQMKKLWKIAQDSMKNRKLIRSEKALLTILKFDEKNAAAYNRLGILYAKEQKFEEAIECFEIAQSLDNNASSLHNAGLIYLETGAYEKAVMAFEQALEMEGDLPARYIALAKAQEKLGQKKAALDALESAFELDHSTNTLRQILSIYEASDDQEGIATTTARIEEQIAKAAAARKNNARSPRTRFGMRNARPKNISKPPRTITTRSHPIRPGAKSVHKATPKPTPKPDFKPAPRPATKTSAAKPPRSRKRKIIQ